MRGRSNTLWRDDLQLPTPIAGGCLFLDMAVKHNHVDDQKVYETCCISSVLMYWNSGKMGTLHTQRGDPKSLRAVTSRGLVYATEDEENKAKTYYYQQLL